MGLPQEHLSVLQATMTCYKCGIAFGVPHHWREKRHEDGETFWCPNGHSQAFCESKTAKLEKELAEERRRVARAEASAACARAEAQMLEHRRRAAVGQVTKLRKRVGNGVCPCCKRSFQNLMRHMKTKHPTFKDAPV